MARNRDEDGAVAPLVAIMVILLIGFASFAVDIGYQRVAARDMQAVADIVAMDMARQLDGRTSSALTGSSWTGQVEASLSRNDDSTVGDSLSVVSCSAAQTTLSGARICATPGILEDGSFRDSGTAPATHVRVITRTKVDYFFPIYADDGWVTKRAYAEAPAGACFSIGSYAARVNSGNSPLLGPLLGSTGSSLKLDVGDYQALAAADVSLVDLLGVKAGVGTLEELISGNELISLGSFYLATAEALKANSAYPAQAVLLQSMAASVGNISLRISDILDLGTGGSSGLDAALNVLDLVTAAAFAANGDNALVIPELKVDLGPLAKVQGNVKVTEPPKVGCGRVNQASGQTSQAGVSLDATAADIDLGIARARVTLNADVQVASAKGRLTSVGCDPNKSIRVRVNDGLVTVDVSFEVVVRVAGVRVLTGPILVKGSYGIDAETQKVILTDADYDTPAHAGAGRTGLPWITPDTSQLDVLGLPLGLGLNAIVSPLLTVIVNPVVQSLDTLVVAPLLSTLGVQISGADVFAMREPMCGIPALRG